MVEAIASWQLGLPGSRELLTSAAAYLLTERIDGPAVVEMASAYPDENGFRIDALVENLITELRLESELSDGPDVPAARSLCRKVLAGEISERNFSRWVHIHFHHESESDLLNELALLDDEYDEPGYFGTDTPSIRSRVRDLATEILGAD
ncbi:MAG: hypothetical protein ABJB03_08005 [Rhodoglobus sp.]